MENAFSQNCQKTGLFLWKIGFLERTATLQSYDDLVKCDALLQIKVPTVDKVINFSSSTAKWNTHKQTLELSTIGRTEYKEML